MVSERGAAPPLSKSHARLVLVACVLASSVVGMDSMMTTNAVARTGSMVAIAFVGLLISLRFSSSLDGELAGVATGAELDRAVEQAGERPLSDVPVDGLSAANRSILEPLLASASIEAFHFGVLVMGGLALVAGVLAFAGLREPRARTYDAAGTLGCPITGARTHQDAPPIGAGVR